MAHRNFKSEAIKLLVLGLPLIGSQIAQFAVHTTDALMVGWYSLIGLAGVTLGGQVYFLLFIFGSGFAFAILPLVAKSAEDGDMVQVRRVTRMGLWISTALFAVMMIPMWWSKPILLFINQDPEIAQIAQDYLRIAGWGLWPTLLVAALRSYLSALERTGIVLWVSLGVLALNAAINYVLIFGNFGAPELGVMGAAIASTAVAIASFIAFYIYVIVVFPEHEIFARIWRADWVAIATLSKLGIPISFTALAESGLFAASAFMMGALGHIELAAHGITLQMAALTFMFHLGLSQAATVRAGQALSQKNEIALARSSQAGYALSIGFGLLAILTFLLVPRFLIGLFLDPADPDAAAVLKMGMYLLILAAIFQWVDGLQVMALGLLRGLQDTKVPMYIAAISYWVLGMPVGYILAFEMGYRETGVWAGLVVGLTATAILLGWRFEKLRRTIKA